MIDVSHMLADDDVAREPHRWRRRVADVSDVRVPASRSILLRVNPFMARALTRAAEKQNVSRTTYMRRALMQQLLIDLDDVSVEQLDHPWDMKKRHYGS